MGLLNNLFSSTEGLAKKVQADSDLIFKQWNEYLDTIYEKQHIILGLNEDNPFKPDLQALMRLLMTDLTDVTKEEKEEAELIRDLEALKHAEKIKRVHKLEQCLGYAETKYEYVYRLLQQLHSCLISEINLAKKLLAGSEPVKLVAHLRYQLTLELAVIEKIKKIETFKDLFSALVKGEHIIKSMDSREKRLIEKMENGVARIFSNEISEGITVQWATTVFAAIENKVHEGVANGMFPGYHSDIDFEFTNRPEFVVLAREVISAIRQRPVSEEMITTFVHLFREWYNHGRD